jgi:hypothetical protein
MTTQTTPGSKALRLYPPPPPDFDPFTATVADLKKHGLPLRPDPYTQPAMAALWDRQARRYRSFDHLEPQPNVAKAAETAVTPFILPLDPIETCGFSLLTTGATIGALFVTWTVPDLQYSPSPIGAPNQFHTFVGLGFLDLHVMMTVDSAQNITSVLWAEAVGDINLPVRPGDELSASLCLETNPRGTAAYFLANETTGQTMNFARRRRRSQRESGPAPRLQPARPVRRRLFRRHQHLHVEWSNVAHLGQRRHHGQRKRLHSRDPRRAHRLRIQGGVRSILIGTADDRSAVQRARGPGSVTRSRRAGRLIVRRVDHRRSRSPRPRPGARRPRLEGPGVPPRRERAWPCG